MDIRVHAKRIEVTDALRAHGERSLEFALKRFGDRVDRVTGWLTAVSGRREGYRRVRSVFVVEAAADHYAALGRIAGRAGRAVGRRLGRDQMQKAGLYECRTSDGWFLRLQPGNEG